MDDFDFAEDLEEEGAKGDERQNRTFIILVAVMGGLLLVGIVAFCAWAILVGQGILSGGGGVADVTPTETIDAAMAIGALTATAEAGMAETPELPTETPEPPPPTDVPATAVATRVPPTPTAQATASVATAGTPGSAAAVASPTVRPAATVTTQPPRELSETGLGTTTIIVLAAVFLFVLIIARRLRTAQ